MTTREEIVALAKECGVTHRTWDYQDEQAVEAFYHAAQRQAYERAVHVCEEKKSNWNYCAESIRSMKV